MRGAVAPAFLFDLLAAAVLAGTHAPEPVFFYMVEGFRCGFFRAGGRFSATMRAHRRRGSNGLIMADGVADQYRV
jgi:hypothetical protein